GDSDGHRGVEIVPAAFEKWVWPDVGNDVQIAQGRPCGSRISAARDTHARARLHARGNSNFDGVHAAHAAVGTAQLAEISNPPRAAAARTGQIETHPAAGLCHLPASAAGRAGLWLANRSRASAVRAGIQARDGELLCGAVHGFPESDFDLVFEARSRLRARRRLGRRATAAEILAE